MADENSIAKFFDDLEKAYGGLDVLVNSAGVMFEKHFLETSIADWDHAMAVNLWGAFICCKYAAELMMKKDGGAIVNIGSIEGMANNPNHVPYAASKAGVQGLTRAIAVDMGQYGIRCNTVCPGWVLTALNENYFKTARDMDRIDAALRALHPSGRLGTPADVANLVSWLSSEEAAWVTGQEFTIDGGRLAKLSGVDFKNLA